MKLLLKLMMFCLLVGSVFIIETVKNTDDDIPIETDYVLLVNLGLAPDSNPRQPTEGDFDTRIRFRDEYGKVYGLYSARDFSKSDFGKTFIWGIR